MNLLPSKKNTALTVILLSLFMVLFFFSCKKNMDDNIAINTPDLATKVTSSVSGFVTDQYNDAIQGALVHVAGINTTTDKYGYFEVKNVQVVKNAATVTVNQPGYFKGIKTYIATENKAAFFRIKLIPKITVGSMNGASGGNVTLANGLIIALPANAVVTLAGGAAYSGTVNVAAHWIDPTVTDLNETMPGDLRGVATDGSLKALTTYGMAAVELTGTSGELLQIAAGKKATLTLTIPSSILATAPATIPLWYFDEANGLWKQEGEATKTGNTYVGEVTHFSFWNCDVPNSYVQFNCTIKDEAGNPIPFALVKISVVGTNNARYSYTDSSGYVGGAVPDNANLLLEVFTSYNCATRVYSQNFATTNENHSLGALTVTTSSAMAKVSGTVTDCNNAPVSDGYIIMVVGNLRFRYSLSSSGTYNFNALLCGSTATVTFVAEDNAGFQQSNPSIMTISVGANAIGNLQACGIDTHEFITYSIDGGTTYTHLATPADTIRIISIIGNVINGSSPANTNNLINIVFSPTGIGAGTIQDLLSFHTPATGGGAGIATGSVIITEYGAIGQFISGNITGVVVTTPTTYNIVCSFKVRRNL